MNLQCIEGSDGEGDSCPGVNVNMSVNCYNISLTCGDRCGWQSPPCRGRWPSRCLSRTGWSALGTGQQEAGFVLLLTTHPAEPLLGAEGGVQVGLQAQAVEPA